MKKLKHKDVSDWPDLAILLVAVLGLRAPFLDSVYGSLYGTMLILGLQSILSY